jgi:RNA polymerase sigma-70 factor (ECF subfamily)
MSCVLSLSLDLRTSGSRTPGLVAGESDGIDVTTLEQSDVELIRGVARGDRLAFETLYWRHAARLRRYLVTMLRQPESVDETLNDVMFAIWRGAARFDPTISRPVTWFLAIAHNKVLDVFAQRRVRSIEVAFDPLDMEHALTTEGSEPAVHPCDPNTPQRTLLARELGQFLNDALGLLSAEHRTVIELAFGQDCSYQEIAAITGVPVNTVKTRMFYARRHLADILQRQGVLDTSDRFP